MLYKESVVSKFTQLMSQGIKNSENKLAFMAGKDGGSRPGAAVPIQLGALWMVHYSSLEFHIRVAFGTADRAPLRGAAGSGFKQNLDIFSSFG